jgi:hypothetical protein
LALNRASFQNSFQKPFEKPNPSSFHSLFGFRNRSLSVQAGVAPCPKTLPPGRPLYADYLTYARHQPMDNTEVMSQVRSPLFPQFFSPSRLRPFPLSVYGRGAAWVWPMVKEQVNRRIRLLHFDVECGGPQFY